LSHDVFFGASIKSYKQAKDTSSKTTHHSEGKTISDEHLPELHFMDQMNSMFMVSSLHIVSIPISKKKRAIVKPKDIDE
jgi:hypothetical protein